MTRQHATITILPENALFLKERGIPLSTFVNQQIENLAKGKEEYLIYSLAVEADRFMSEHKKRVEELKKRGYSNYQAILTDFQSMIISDEERKMGLLWGAMPIEIKKHIGTKSENFALAWVEGRAPGFGINRPAAWVLDKLKGNGFGEAKA